ncbi:MAG: DUF1232 domain-containing protein [Oligoflexia bacterium]|nr:DUF1232 domain-containing protein [Oligoflexia bacterium]
MHKSLCLNIRANKNKNKNKNKIKNHYKFPLYYLLACISFKCAETVPTEIERLFIKNIKKFFNDIIQFIKDVSNDSRIPDRDKKVIAVLMIYILSPIDLIPDWVPVIGLLDDFIALSIILDYLFNVLDNKILLSHFHWSMKTFVAIKKISRFVAILTPNFFKNKIWKYKKDPYSK